MGPERGSVYRWFAMMTLQHERATLLKMKLTGTSMHGSFDQIRWLKGVLLKHDCLKFVKLRFCCNEVGVRYEKVGSALVSIRR